jgi:hypothetical protein
MVSRSRWYNRKGSLRAWSREAPWLFFLIVGISPDGQRSFVTYSNAGNSTGQHCGEHEITVD